MERVPPPRAEWRRATTNQHACHLPLQLAAAMQCKAIGRSGMGEGEDLYGNKKLLTVNESCGVLT